MYRLVLICLTLPSVVPLRFHFPYSPQRLTSSTPHPHDLTAMCLGGDVAGLRVLVDKGGLDLVAQSDCLALAASKGQLLMVKYLLDIGIDVGGKGVIDPPALHRAALSGHKRIVELLLDRGADIDSREGVYHQTALHWAVKGGADTLGVVRILLDRGADPNAAGVRASPPLFSAAYRDNAAAIRLLAVRGARFDAINDHWETAWGLAQEAGASQALAELETLGAPRGFVGEAFEGPSRDAGGAFFLAAAIFLLVDCVVFLCAGDARTGNQKSALGFISLTLLALFALSGFGLVGLTPTISCQRASTTAHFLLLSAFVWSTAMIVDAVRAVTFKSVPESKWFLPGAAAFALGVPIVVVVAFRHEFPDDYFQERSLCLLGYNVVKWGFVLPVVCLHAIVVFAQGLLLASCLSQAPLEFIGQQRRRLFNKSGFVLLAILDIWVGLGFFAFVPHSVAGDTGAAASFFAFNAVTVFLGILILYLRIFNSSPIRLRTKAFFSRVKVSDANSIYIPYAKLQQAPSSVK